MEVLIIVLVVLLVGFLLAADRAMKAVGRGRRRRLTNERLAVVAAAAEAKERKRRAVAEAEAALTSVMPTIHEHDPRRVDWPDVD